MANSAINMKAVYISAGAVVLAAAVTGIFSFIGPDEAEKPTETMTAETSSSQEKNTGIISGGNLTVGEGAVLQTGNGTVTIPGKTQTSGQ